MGNCTGHTRADAHNEQNNKYVTINKIQFYRLLVKTSTWVRDSHELFDYESLHLVKKTFKLHNILSGIQRNDNECSLVTEDTSSHSHHRLSFSSSKSHSGSKDKTKQSQHSKSQQKISEELKMLAKLEHQPITFINQHLGVYTIFDLPHQYNPITQRSVILKKDEMLKIQSDLQKNNAAPSESSQQSAPDNSLINKNPQQQQILDYGNLQQQLQNQNQQICDKELLNELNQDQNRLWLIVRYLTVDGKTNQFQLTGGETIKLGRVKFTIREIHVGADDDNQTNYCDNSFEANLQEDSGDYESPRLSDQQANNNRRSDINGRIMPPNRVVRLRSSDEDIPQNLGGIQQQHERQLSQDVLQRPGGRQQIQLTVNNRINNFERDSIEDYKSAEDRIVIEEVNSNLNLQNPLRSPQRRHELDYEEEKKQSFNRNSVERLVNQNRNQLNLNHASQSNRIASKSQHYDLRGANQGQFQDTLICLSQEEQRIRDSLMGFDPNQEFHGSQGYDPVTELFDPHTQINNFNENQRRISNYIRDDFDVQEDEVMDEDDDHLMKNMQEHQDILEQSFASEKDKEELHKTMYSNKAQSENSNLCRICFSELFTDENPLISPCKCSGSMKFIHLECLRTWLSRKENVKNSANVISYSWRAFHCELCKSEYNDRINVDGRQYWLFEIQKPKTNYVVLESMSLQNAQGPNQQQAAQNNNSKTLHILNLNQKNQIKIGRGHDNDLRVADISVSRCHAFIKRDPKGFIYLEDNQSKFGTLVMVKAPLILNDQLTYYIQAGRTIMKLHVQPEWSILGGIMKSSLLSSHHHNNNPHRKQSLTDKQSQSQLSNKPIKRKLSNINDVFYQSISKFCNQETTTLIKAFVSDLKHLRDHQLIQNENLVGSQIPTPRQLIHSKDQSFSENIPEEKEDFTSQNQVNQLQNSKLQSLMMSQHNQDNTSTQVRSLQMQDLSGLNHNSNNQMLLSPQNRNLMNGKIQEIKTNSFQIKLTSLKDKFSNEKIKSHETVNDHEDDMEQWLNQRGNLFLSQNHKADNTPQSRLHQQQSDEQLLVNFRSLNQSKDDFFKESKMVNQNLSSVKTPPSFQYRKTNFHSTLKSQKLNQRLNDKNVIQRSIYNQANKAIEEMKVQQPQIMNQNYQNNKINQIQQQISYKQNTQIKTTTSPQQLNNKLLNGINNYSLPIQQKQQSTYSVISPQRQISQSINNNNARQSVDSQSIKEEGKRVSQLGQNQLKLSQNQQMINHSNNMPTVILQNDMPFAYNQVKLPNTTSNVSRTSVVNQGYVPSKVVKQTKQVNKNIGSSSWKIPVQSKMQQDIYKQTQQASKIQPKSNVTNLIKQNK